MTAEEVRALQERAAVLYRRMARTKSRKRAIFLARAYGRTIDRILDYKRERNAGK